MNDNNISHSISEDIKAYQEWAGSKELNPLNFISYLKGEEYKETSYFSGNENLNIDYNFIKEKLEPHYFEIIPKLIGIKQKDFNKMSDKNKSLFIEEGYRLCVLRNKI